MSFFAAALVQRKKSISIISSLSLNRLHLAALHHCQAIKTLSFSRRALSQPLSSFLVLIRNKTRQAGAGMKLFVKLTEVGNFVVEKLHATIRFHIELQCYSSRYCCCSRVRCEELQHSEKNEKLPTKREGKL